MKKKTLEYEKPVLHTLMQGMGMDVATGVDCKPGSGPTGGGGCRSGNMAVGGECRNGQGAAGGDCRTGASASTDCRAGGSAVIDCRSGSGGP